MTGAPAPIIFARGITRVYAIGAREISVLTGVDLTIASEEVVALVGASGSGKSTLLNILGCLDRPTRGTYLLGGQDVSQLSRDAQAWVRLHYLGFVFQSFHLIAHATALENVAVPLYYAGHPRRRREARAFELLERVGLLERASHRPAELSGGERQRVAIARALALGPRLLLADEPTGALDSHSSREILDLITGLRDTDGLTMVLVTHDPDVAAHADRRIHLGDGRIVAPEASRAP